MPTKPRRALSDRLREALGELAQGHARFLTHGETAWASATFSGSRHRVELEFAGADAVECGETFIALLPEHEFAIPGQLVADAAITAVAHRLAPRPEMTLTAELLLLEDA